MPTAYLAIDLGAESGRAIVGTLAGGKIGLEEVHRFTHIPVMLPSGLHWDVTGLWREICAGLKAAGDWSSAHHTKVTSVGVDTWGVDWGLLDAAGELAALPHAYRDPRNQAAYETALAKLGEDAIYRTTGIQFMALNTLYSFYAQSLSDRPSVDRADSLLFMPDLFHYWLSGQRSIEATIASTSQMVDCHSRTWAANLLEPLGLPAKLLGEISPPGSTVGTLREELAALSGLSVDLKVVAPGSHDTASAVAAVPAASEGDWCYLSSGTWSLLGAELDEPCVTPAAQAAMFTNELGVGGKTRFLKNIIGLWMVQECRRDFQRKGNTLDNSLDYASLTAEAATAEPFRTLLDTSHSPFTEPGDMLAKIADYATSTGQPVPETPGQFIRACLESLAIVYRQTLDMLEEILGRKFEVLHVVGGGGKNTLLNQMTADATQRTVKVGPYEATAIGNILTQAIGAGDVADLSELRRIVANSFEVETFEPQSASLWQAAGERMQNLMQA